MRFLKKSSKKSKKTGDNSSLQAFILEPILTPSGVVDSPDTPDLGMVDVDAFDPADIDVDLEDSIEEGNLATTQEQGTQVWEPVDFVDTIEPQDGDIISDENLEPLEFISETEAAAILSSLESDPTFESGVFTVGETGKVSVDFLFDGGGYEGELAVFSLEGMEEFEPGSEAFIQEAASRALSDSDILRLR
ncbi:hypothetical protein [Coleofasciculus sp.]|uniref:hypothetical protein n=1 Tax=Coleofasciculus sp. TaxID=3100458 RepID=UPI003A1CC640